MSATEVRLMLVDDHAVVREGLRAVFMSASRCRVVAEAGSGEEALRLAEAALPDVVMMDLMMPGLTAAETISQLKRILPACNVIVFTSFGEDAALRATLQAGALGYLLKDASREDLLSAVYSVAQGRAWLNESMQRQLLEMMRRPAPEDPFARLTPRERSVLELIGQGLNNRRIAVALELTEGTVKGYVSNVLEKLGVEDRTQAALVFKREQAGL